MSMVFPVFSRAPAGRVGATTEPPALLEPAPLELPLATLLAALLLTGALDEAEPPPLDATAEEGVLTAELGAELEEFPPDAAELLELVELAEELDEFALLLLLQAATNNPADRAMAKPARFFFTCLPSDRRITARAEWPVGFFNR